MLPIMAAQLYWPFQMLPNGAAMLVTKEIIAKMKHMVTTATMLTFFLDIFVNIKKNHGLSDKCPIAHEVTNK